MKDCVFHTRCVVWHVSVSEAAGIFFSSIPADFIGLDIDSAGVKQQSQFIKWKKTYLANSLIKRTSIKNTTYHIIF